MQHRLAVPHFMPSILGRELSISASAAGLYSGLPESSSGCLIGRQAQALLGSSLQTNWAWA